MANVIGSQIYMVSQEWMDEVDATIKFIREKVVGPDEKKKVHEYITAQEFMDACRIGRSKFDELREERKIKVIKKGRKLYTEADEVKRYFDSVE